MNRLIPVLLVASIAGLAVWWGTSDSRGGDYTSREADSAERTAEGADLESVGGSGLARTDASAASPTEWTVTISHRDGRPIDAAVAVATWNGNGDVAALEGGGAKTTWADPRPGTWTLEVKLEGEPAWQRDVVVTGGESRRTIVLLGGAVTVTGTVRDEYGDPLETRFVGFIDADSPTPNSATEWLAMPHARTDRHGSFRAEVRRPGAFRVFVGWGGEVLVEDATPRRLDHGRDHHVDLVVPVPTRVLLEARETDGGELEPPYAVSIYRREEIMDVVRPVPKLPPAQPIPDPDDPSLDADQREELLAEIEAMNRPLDAAAAERRASVKPDGFRVDRSLILSATGTAELTGLPVGEELRFAAARAQEPFRVTQSGIVDPLQATRFVLTFPPSEGATTDEVRMAVLETVLDEARERPLSPGVTWR